MSGYSAWKTMERRFAKLMRGERLWRPDYGDSIPDGENETHTWDTKAYQRHAAVTLFVQNEKKYREYTGKRRFVLALFARNYRSQGDFVLVRAKDYARDQEIIDRVRRCAAMEDTAHGVPRSISTAVMRDWLT